MCGFDSAMGNLCSMGPKGLTISITISTPENASTRLGGEPERIENVRDYRGKSDKSFGKMDKEDDKSLDSLKPNKPKKNDEGEDKDNEDERWNKAI